MTTTEIIGYIGLALVAGSFFLSNVLWLRILNLIGAVTMTIYGTMIDSVPVTVLNSVIVVANTIHIRKLNRTKVHFGLIKEKYHHESAFDLFYHHYERDIQKHFPRFSLKHVNEYEIELVYRNMTLAGAFVYQIKNNELFIFLDYVAPEYRDLSNSVYLFSTKEEGFRKQGLRRMTAFSNVSDHMRYLKKMGFSNSESEPNIFVKPL